MKRLNNFVLVLFFTLLLGSTAFGAIIVGRITHVEGQIYRYMDVDQSWVETFIDSPAGTQDILTTGADSRAEIKFPNSMLLRLDANAEIEILQLREEEGKFILQNGLARFYNQSTAGSMLIETERGTAVVGPGSTVDMRVAEGVVAVSAAQGQAAFQSRENGVEKQEVISGSTRLEFQSESIVAGVGPLDRNWEGWCADRENVWSQNRIVRSEYLPETIQEYAYVLEPYGSWRRIYYRGYYYWAWQPSHLASGWAPYTTGYWYDWQDEPVWIDYNPWGWVTHHHGHWLHMYGAWMWTPYVHVSHVPGITVVGFNIHFGRNYRPYWHPGRVRWISQTSHIGWLPLTPWETYYGYHRWGPRSVVVPGDINFSININLGDHRYIDHAVIVPRKDFQRRRPVAINHYNTVRVRKTNKTIIARNYKPIPTLEKPKFKKNIAQAPLPDRILNRSAVHPERQAIKRPEVPRKMRNVQNVAPRTYGQKNEPIERITYNSRQTALNREPEFIRKKKALTVQEKNIPKPFVRPEQSRNSITHRNKPLQKPVTGRNEIKERLQRANSTVEKSQERVKAPGRAVINNSEKARRSERAANGTALQPARMKKTERAAVIQGNSRSSTRQNTQITARKNTREKKRQTLEKTQVIGRQGQKNIAGAPASHENSKKSAGNGRGNEAKQEIAELRRQPYKSQERAPRARYDTSLQSGEGTVSSSLQNRRLR